MSRAVKGSSHAGKGKSRKKSTEIRERILQTPNSREEDEQETEFTQLRERPASSSAQTSQAGGSTGRNFLLLLVIFLAYVLVLLLVYYSFPNVTKEEAQYIKLPRNIEDAKNLGRLLKNYSGKYYYPVLFGYFVIYIFLQTFAIPGSIFLSIISGFLYPFYLALPLVCTCASIGASFCYLLSYLVGKRIVEKYLPERAADWKTKVDNQREHLMNYIIFLRVTPFLPNWFINIVSPVIDVPLSTFFIGTWIGVGPPTFVFIQAGTMLNELTSTSEAWSWTNVALLAVFAVVAVLPVAFKNTLRAKIE